MSLEIVRVEKWPRLSADAPLKPETLHEKVWQGLKRRPALALAAAPVIAASGPATAVAATLATVAIAGQEAYLRYHDRPAPEFDERDVERLYPSDLVGMTDVRGKTLQSSTFYVRHPVHAKRHILIPARSFHKIIFEEQMADIIAYIRSRLSVTAITIDAVSQSTGAVVAGGSIQSVPLGFKLGLTRAHRHAVRFATRSPKPVAVERELHWIEDYPMLVAALADAHDGEFETGETTDLEFGLSLNVAQHLGIDVRWVSKFSLDIKVEFA